MEKKVAKFFSSSKISPNEIMYIIHEGRKSVLYLHNGSSIDTYIPIKHILAALPAGNFVNITKGVVLARSAILAIEGITYMTIDGKSFEGRHRGTGEHKRNRMALEDTSLPDNRIMGENIRARFAALDRLPLPACVVEIVFNSAGHSVDFIYRYCNNELAKAYMLDVDEMVDKLNTDLARSITRQWVVAFSECALKGIPQIVKLNARQYGGQITGYCYCPAPGYCAAIIIPEGIEDRINEESGLAKGEYHYGTKADQDQ